MAVLNLLLDNNVSARSMPELANVVAQHNAWTQDRKFLLVPYHMIGARSMESAILGGYAEFVRKRHPDAPSRASTCRSGCSKMRCACASAAATRPSSAI
jgi:hypothetical protein